MDDNTNINNVLEEIQTSENIAIHVLKDTVIDYRRYCKRLIIAASISIILNLIFILYYIFSIV